MEIRTFLRQRRIARLRTKLNDSLPESGLSLIINAVVTFTPSLRARFIYLAILYFPPNLDPRNPTQTNNLNENAIHAGLRPQMLRLICNRNGGFFEAPSFPEAIHCFNILPQIKGQLQ